MLPGSLCRMVMPRMLLALVTAIITALTIIVVLPEMRLHPSASTHERLFDPGSVRR